MNYPKWFERTRNVHKFGLPNIAGLKSGEIITEDGEIINKLCLYCSDMHSEVEEILINLAGWQCKMAREYDQKILKLALSSRNMPNSPESNQWPWKRCQLYRKGMHYKKESDQDYYYRLRKVIESKQYREIFAGKSKICEWDEQTKAEIERLKQAAMKKAAKAGLEILRANKNGRAVSVHGLPVHTSNVPTTGTNK